MTQTLVAPAPAVTASSVRLVYFAWVRERIGLSEEQVELPAGTETVLDLVRWLKTRDEGYQAAFADEKLIRAAIDRVHAKPGTRLGHANEIAFFPPMTGG